MTQRQIDIINDMLCLWLISVCRGQAGTFLAEQVGEDNKQAVFSSRGRNMACWSIRATADEAKALSADELMQ